MWYDPRGSRPGIAPKRGHPWDDPRGSRPGLAPPLGGMTRNEHEAGMSGMLMAIYVRILQFLLFKREISMF